MYADYEFYTSVYNGAVIGETDFPAYALKASVYLDYCTMGRAKKRPNLPALKIACCALAEQYQVIDTATALAQAALATGVTSVSSSTTGELQSQTVGGWSKSYRSGGDSAKNTLGAAEDARAALGTIAEQYLAGTGLLHARGYRA